MADRVTKKDAERVVQRLAEVLGLPYGHYRKTDDGIETVLYGLVSDYSEYGGCVVEQVVNEGGGVTQPFGSQRRAPREFVDFINGVLAGIFIHSDNRFHGLTEKP